MGLSQRRSNPSIGNASQSIQLPDLASPPTTTAAEERKTQIQPAAIHRTHRYLHIQEQKKGQHKRHLAKAMKCQPRSPVHDSPTSPQASEKNAVGVKARPRNFIPQRRQLLRHAEVARTQPSSAAKRRRADPRPNPSRRRRRRRRDKRAPRPTT